MKSYPFHDLMHYLILHFANRRVYLSVAAAAIYMASQASDQKKTQKGKAVLAMKLFIIFAFRGWRCCGCG